MNQPYTAYPDLAEVGSVSGAAFVIRRTLFETLGGFDPSFFMYMEDTDLSLRARLAGWRILYVPDSIVYHDYRLTFGPRKTYYQERNRYWLLLKVFRQRTLIALLPALLLAELVAWGFVLLRDRRNWANKLQAYRVVIRDREQLKLARRQTQALRRVPDSHLLAQAHFRLGYEQTGHGLLTTLAHWIFDPLFWLARLFARLLTRALCA
jgi:hypothetical protein